MCSRSWRSHWTRSLGAPQIFVVSKSTGEIDTPDLPVGADENVGEVGVGVVDKFVEDTDFVHLFVPGFRVGRIDFPGYAVLFIHFHGKPPAERTQMALPAAFDVNRKQVIDADKFSEIVGGDVCECLRAGTRRHE
jgi:hypothetical protein